MVSMCVYTVWYLHVPPPKQLLDPGIWGIRQPHDDCAIKHPVVEVVFFVAPHAPRWERIPGLERGANGLKLSKRRWDWYTPPLPYRRSSGGWSPRHHTCHQHNGADSSQIVWHLRCRLPAAHKECLPESLNDASFSMPTKVIAHISTYTY